MGVDVETVQCNVLSYLFGHGNAVPADVRHHERHDVGGSLVWDRESIGRAGSLIKTSTWKIIGPQSGHTSTRSCCLDGPAIGGREGGVNTDLDPCRKVAALSCIIVDGC